MLTVAACSDWTSPDARNYEPAGVEGSDKDEAYYSALREWKNSRTLNENGVPNRSVTFGWFSDWTGIGTNMSGQLMGLPDSVDFVSMWGNWYGLSDEKKEDLRKVQQIKGTKVLICFIIDNIGVQTTPKEIESSLTVNGVKYASREEALGAYWGWFDDEGTIYGSADQMEPAIRKYARSILDTIKAYNWDGFDLDLEPYYGHWGNLSGYPDRLGILLDEMSKELGPKSGTGKMLCVDGEPYLLNESDTELLDFFILQAYNDSRSTSIDGRMDRLFSAFPNMKKEAIVGKTILCSNFESYGNTGGPTYRITGQEGTTFQLNGFAQYKYPGLDCRIGGIGAFRMIFDSNYKYFREAMHTLHSQE